LTPGPGIIYGGKGGGFTTMGTAIVTTHLETSLLKCSRCVFGRSVKRWKVDKVYSASDRGDGQSKRNTKNGRAVCGQNLNSKIG
jgi:hypothetical protein